MIYALVLVTIIAATFVWMHIKGLDLIAEKKAIKDLEHLLFTTGQGQRENVIASIHKMTNHRLTDDEALDYFLKIKGLQVINLHDPINYWTRKYLMSSTKTKLNYFEQVRFYEAFLNYPEAGRKVVTRQDKASSLSGFPLTQAAQELLKTNTVFKLMA
jgi:hypothetical protein